MTTRLTPGDTAPDFTLPDADGKPVSLADYRGRRVVVYFYPAAGTPVRSRPALHDSLTERTGLA
jgi:peroxiredoxin Q/BCP